MKFSSVRTVALSLSVLFSFAFSHVSAQPSNGILREVYANIGGNSISDLTSHPSFPDSPTSENILTDYFEGPVDVLENYGSRLRALITPPLTGNYRFWIATDDNGQLWLSTDANPANKTLIARVNGWTSSREWTKEANQESAPIHLVAGQQYYIEALQKEGGGGDNVAVRWQLPNGTIEQPIPATRCVPYGLGPPLITQQPANVTIVEGGTATFTVRPARTLGSTFQWQRDGVNIPGANSSSYSFGPVTLADSNTFFRCYIVNAYGNVTSAEARLSVFPDTTRPSITSVGNAGDPEVLTVVFSEPVDAATATETSNYTINNGVAVLHAAFGVDARTIVLTTTPMAPNVTHTLTVNNVRDRATTPNAIAPNTQRTFSIVSRPLNISFLKPPPEPVGPSTRRGPLVISEVMYHPADRADGRNVEFIEIFNSQPWYEELGGYRISGAIEYTFPSNFVLQARSYAVIAAVPSDVQSVYGITGVLGPWSGALENSAGTLRLHNSRGAVLCEMDYAGEPPFPAAADGGGHSLVLAYPSLGEGDPRAWAASDLIGGSPKAAETSGSNPYRTVMINEFLAHTDLPAVDYLELFNYSAQAVNISGCVLTDDPIANKFIVPANTSIPANGFVVFDEAQLGFALNAGGETIYFKNPQDTRVLDAIRFEGQENGVATGRYPDGAPHFSRLQQSTPGTNNARLRAPVVVINELMYHPISEENDDEFIELHNTTTNAISLGRWRIKDAVQFTIPDGTIIPPLGYLVIARDAGRLRDVYPGLTKANCVGDYEGSLANSSDRVTLTMPEQIITTNEFGQLFTNTIHIVKDEVTYQDGGRWGRWSPRGGSSLELRDAFSDRRLAPNWGDSDERAKSGWVTVEHTGLLDHSVGSADSLQILLMGPGECLVDNVEVRVGNGPNLIANSTFESGADGWFFQGNHHATSLESGAGYNSSRSLHIRASGRGDTGANRVRTAITTPLGNGQTATIRARVKWLAGSPQILFRFRGNHLEAPGTITDTSLFGTPGARNSIAVTNAGPAITDVSHSPILPAGTQPVLVTARVSDPDGIASLFLKYRIDPATNYTTVAMTNNGAGLYSAVIPGQSSGQLAAFHLQATDKLSPSLATLFPDDAPLRECLVRWGEPTPSGVFGTYRVWMTQATMNEWTQREKLSNQPLDVTFAYGNYRVIYNAGAEYAGSPYHAPGYNSPVGNACDYVLIFPQDSEFLGDNELTLAWPGNGGGDGTAQAEQTAYWIAGQLGHPFCYRRYVHVYVNGVKRNTIMEDVQQPNNDLGEQWFPEADGGEVHKIQLWFEFDDAAAGFSATGASLGNFTTSGGVKKLARYRWNWAKRGFRNYLANDYTNILGLIDAVNMNASGETYTSLINQWVDVDEWGRTLLVEKIVGNWDSYGNGGGQNMYVYKPNAEPWRMMIWDIDFAFQSGSPTENNIFNITDGPLTRIFDHPPFRRLYWRAIREAAEGPLARVNALIDAKYAALTANGANVSSPQGIKNYISARRDFLLSLLQNSSPPTTFDITSNGGNSFSTSNNLVTLTGRAGVDVATIEINGVAYDLTWTSLNGWSLRFPLGPGTNVLNVRGYDQFGRLVSGASDTITVTYTAPAELPQDFIVINEIMFNPVVPGAEYVELFNTSSAVSFDLSNWRFDGLDFVFPEGTIMGPRSFIVLAKDRAAFASAYGTNVIPNATFAGTLQPGGEALSLVKPGVTANKDGVIDAVRYDDEAPWPGGIPGVASSVQLIDATQDNSRVANWAGLSPADTNAVWRFVSVTAPMGPTARLLVYLGQPGEVYIDDLSLVAGTLPGVGENFVRNGDFESGLAEAGYVFGTNYTNSARSTAFKHSGNSSLHIVATTFGSSLNRIIYQNLDPAPPDDEMCVLSYWYLPSESGTNLTVRVQSSSISSTVNYRPDSATGTACFTPGTTNTFAAPLPEFPPLWINEVQAHNVSGITDGAGEHEPWVELYNAGTNAVSLNGLFLADNFTNLTQWAFPSGAIIGPKQFQLVFLDGETNESAAGELHAGLRLANGAGALALSRLHLGAPQVLDFVNFTGEIDRSFGSVPDGQSIERRELFYVTPGATNNGAFPPIVVRINEWMADNVGTLADPADGNFEDWIELYNPGTNSVSLGGCFLTDALADPFKFRIPNGYSIPPGGHLLVWADGEDGQNSSSRTDLHVDFSLAKSGEAIGLFAPDGGQIDAVVFGPQTTDVSMGRFPDGDTMLFSLTNATPGAPNIIPQPNVAPVLAPLSDATIGEGHLLTFQALAIDSNFPPQTLTWSLDAGAPANAMIDPASGVFSWLPGESEGGNTYTITVRVIDGGVPPLDDSATFAVTVLETNNAPELVTTGDKVVNEGDLLSFLVSASDSDEPPQTLTFSLGPDAPAEASIEAASGLFNWTPGEADGPGVYTVTIRVTDDGTPPLSDEATITVTVNEGNSLRIDSVSLTNGMITIGWTSIPGRTYRVEFKERLDAAEWLPLGDDLPATDTTLTVSEPVGTNTQRLYRIVLLP